jgi:hypothetical protein
MVSSTVKLMSQMRIQWYRKRDASVSPTKFSLGCQYNWCLPKSRGNYRKRPLIQNILVNQFLETYRILLSERIVAGMSFPKGELVESANIWGKSSKLDSLISTLSLYFRFPRDNAFQKLS